MSGRPLPFRDGDAYNLPVASPRVHGRRSVESADIAGEIRALQGTLNRMRRWHLVPKGVYRFSGLEEADAWMTRQIAATHARLSSKTS